MSGKITLIHSFQNERGLKELHDIMDDRRRHFPDTGKGVITSYVDRPESGLHPRAQIGMSKKIVDEMKTGRSYVIFSHSEILCLYLLREIDEERLSCDDVLFLVDTCGEEGDDGEFKEYRPLPDGDFAYNWPHGFFDERGDLLFY